MRAALHTNGGDYIAWLDRELERLDKSIRRLGAALWIFYGGSCGASSFGVAHFWGWAGQLIVLPLYFAGGVVLARIMR